MTERTRGRLYGRRKGPKLSAHQQHLLDHLLPRFELHLHAHADPRTYFAEPVEDVWLEVGFGGGEHLVWQARHHSNVGIIGAEPYVNGVVKLLSHIEALIPTRSPSARNLPVSGGGKDAAIYSSTCKGEDDPRSGSGGGPNIRIHTSDARDILETLPDQSLGRVFILFPDPWPKTRHHKRRFIQAEMLDQLARVMRHGAELRFASDDADYVEWTLERLTSHPSFAWTATRNADWQTRSSDWPATRYEAKQLHGKPTFLRFLRR